MKKGGRLGLDRYTRLRSQELERRLGFNLVHELARDVGAGLGLN